MHRSPFFASSRLRMRALTPPSLASPWSFWGIWQENASSYNNSYELTQQRGICETDNQFPKKFAQVRPVRGKESQLTCSRRAAATTLLEKPRSHEHTVALVLVAVRRSTAPASLTAPRRIDRDPRSLQDTTPFTSSPRRVSFVAQQAGQRRSKAGLASSKISCTPRLYLAEHSARATRHKVSAHWRHSARDPVPSSPR